MPQQFFFFFFKLIIKQTISKFQYFLFMRKQTSKRKSNDFRSKNESTNISLQMQSNLDTSD